MAIVGTEQPQDGTQPPKSDVPDSSAKRGGQAHPADESGADAQSVPPGGVEGSSPAPGTE